MIKKTVILFLSIFTAVSIFAQDTPSGGFLPEDVIIRLSYENFKNLKLLSAAIMNFGGGESEFKGLVQTYAQATSLYFQKKNPEAAKEFQKNEDDIQKTGMDLAVKYNERTNEIQTEIIEYNVRTRIDAELKGERIPAPAEKLLSQAIEAMRFANDLKDREKPVEAIDYYRIAKKKCFEYYEVMATFDKNLKIDEIREKYEKDMKDNESQIYTSKEKKN
ncbi:MAG: hypothetical protein JW982_08850 [Spirochaetes bacterium]|nr:hypothetical protein [Spirochaetota bacterium]